MPQFWRIAAGAIHHDFTSEVFRGVSGFSLLICVVTVHGPRVIVTFPCGPIREYEKTFNDPCVTIIDYPVVAAVRLVDNIDNIPVQVKVLTSAYLPWRLLVTRDMAGMLWG
jgi:hypothetical protein